MKTSSSLFVLAAASLVLAAPPAAAQPYPAPAPAPRVVPAPAPAPYVRPAPAPAPPPLMARREAISRAFQYCRERRFRCELVRAELAGEVWLVDLRAQRGPLRGPLHVGLDAVTRQLVAADEPREAPPPPPPPPPPPRIVSAGEAASLGSEACAQRGYACRLVASSLAMPVWRLEFDARRHDRAGPLHVEIDAYTRGLVRLDEPRPPPPPPPPPPMSYEEASQRGLQYCQSRGYACRVEDADLHRRRNVWRVTLAALPPRHGHVRLELEATTRALLDAREHVREGEWRASDDRDHDREHEREHDHDRDHDHDHER